MSNHEKGVSLTDNHSTTRRGFFKGAAVFLLPFVFRRARAEVAPRKREVKSGTRLWGMVIDLDRCTACQSCVIACSVENNQMLGNPQEAAMGRVIRWIRVQPVVKESAGGSRQSLMPMPCMQCEDPPCIKVCPTAATFLDPEGIVGQVYPRCIGCRYCVNSCPYTAKFFNWETPSWPKPMAEAQNPDVSPRYKGIVEKCLFCHQRLQRAKEKAAFEKRALAEGDYIPACVLACPAKAIAFGDLNDPGSEVSRLSQSPRAYRLLDELGTEPKVSYLREE
jgi:molybdopterin-containing oxidoreductase family iron-sulfur binding subunit